MKILLELAARLLLAAWSAGVLAYAALCETPFSWVAFVQARFYPAWYGVFLSWNAAFAAVAFALAAAALPAGRARRAWAAGGVLVAAASLAAPLASLSPGPRAAAALAFSALPWLCWEMLLLRSRLPALDVPVSRGGELGRLSGAALAGLAAAAGSLFAAGDGAVASALSLALHLTLFSAVFAALEAARAAAASRRALAALEAGALALAVWFGVDRLVFDAIGLHEPAAHAGALVFAAAFSAGLLAQGLALSASEEPLFSAAGDGLAARAGLLAAAILWPYAAKRLIGGYDWGGLIESLSVGGAWLAAFGALRPRRARGPSWRAAAAACGALALACAAARTAAVRVDPGLRLEGRAPAALLAEAAAHDASLRLARRLASPASGSTFFSRLQANTNFSRSEIIDPVQIDLVDAIDPGVADKPNVFILVVDSLRQDYVGTFNPKVAFTPAIDALARDGVSWPSFTAYGASALSEPALWAGALLIHKIYVTPFAPMNALDRLVRALGYERYVMKDPVLDELLAEPRAHWIDARSPVHRLCATLAEFEGMLDAVPKGKPIFFYAQPQDIHLAVISREGRTNVTGKSYPGFDAAYASRVERADACLGTFVAALKKRGLYDDSVIVVTGDHGDSLSEEGRWGHAYALFPEVVRTPLVLRLPRRLREGFTFDRDGQAFSIDITPTLYQLLGQGAPRLDPLLGRPLAARGRDPKAWRKDEQLIVSSYGPTYGLLEKTGRYSIADGVNYKFYAYDLASDPYGRRPRDPGADRKRVEKRILWWLDRLNAFWGRSRR